jgi:hypothetical protein
MKIVQGEDVPFEQRKEQHRKGTFRFKRVIEGPVGTAGNFYFQMVHTIDDFFSPRHRHNFDQFRYQLEGTFDFSRNGKMKPGMVGYFPEATPYGPQTSSESSLTAVLQFGGASGNGYMAEKELQNGTAELKKFGEFKDGVFRRNEDVEGKRNMDGYQAVWEHVNQRPMVYPEPRYHDPIMMEPDNYDWVPVEDAPGVSQKLLGIFTERRIESAFFRVAPQSVFRAKGRGIYFVVSGAGTVEGQPYKRYTAVHVDQGESASFMASEDTVILLMGLPNLAGMALPRRDSAQAAE